jgi:DNA polymerase IV
MPQRIIAHFDLDAFFVNVELLKNPELRGKPILVGGDGNRGIVSTCSYEARAFGIHSAMPMATAKRLCPQAIVLNSSRSDYGKYSRYVTEIIAAKAPLFEKASIDEFYLDLTGMDKYHNVLEWTKELRQEIMDKTLLPISFGLGSNKMIAKIATDEAKPNGFIFVQYGKEKDFLAGLKVNKFSGVGESTYKVLVQMGINTIGDITKRTEQEMELALGKHGSDLWHKAQGKHTRIVTPYRESKSVSSENTFNEDTKEETFLLAEIVRLTEKIGHELRDDGKMATAITIKIRYKGFETTSKQTTINATDYDHDFIPAAKELFHQLYRKGELVRLIGVRLSNFVLPYQQADLFSNKEKLNNLYKAIDEVKDKFGRKLLNRAGGK